MNDNTFDKHLFPFLKFCWRLVNIIVLGGRRQGSEIFESLKTGPALRAERDWKIRKDVRIEWESQRSVHDASILLNANVLLNQHLKLKIDWPVRSFCVLWAALWPFRRPRLRTCPGNYGMKYGNISVHLQPVVIYKINHKWYQRKINLPPVTTCLLLFPHL